MNPLHFELERLYGPGAGTTGRGHGAGGPCARALVLELAARAGWARLSSVWRGVQSELALPAPAIAVSGVDRLQLWFSLDAEAPRRAGVLFLQGLRARYLPDLESGRMRLIAEAAELPAPPPVEMCPGQWSAFVASDLAALFEESPWLDVLPTDEGQAALLRPLQSMPRAAFEAASRRLGVEEDGEPQALDGPTPGAARPGPVDRNGDADPVRFLTEVMNDAAAPLSARVDAAKALLPYVRPY